MSLLAEELLPAPPAADVRARLLDAIRGPERFTPHAPDVARLFGLALADAREALLLVQQSSAWQPGFHPNSQHLFTDALTQRSALIARLPAGMRIPRHVHQARELTSILDGELLEDGKLLHVSGAIMDMASGSAHELVVRGQLCLVVFALQFGYNPRT
jgi:putative transcriptional regulator